MQDKLYDGLPAKKAYLEYALEILNLCLTPEGFKEAELVFGKLEMMLKDQKASEEYLGALEKAKVKFSEMKTNEENGIQLFSNEYNKPLAEMRDILLESAQEFEGHK